jgi:hypothetical protein
MHIPFLMWDQTINSSMEVMFSAYMICGWFLVYVMIISDWWRDSAPSVSTSVAAQHGFPLPLSSWRSERTSNFVLKLMR